MGTFDYISRQKVIAAQWKEDNLEEMQQFLYDYVEKDVNGVPRVYSEEIEPYFLQYRGKSHANPGYKMLKFYADDDMEVDPGEWVIVYEDSEIEIMDDDQFHKMFVKD